MQQQMDKRNHPTVLPLSTVPDGGQHPLDYPSPVWHLDDAVAGKVSDLTTPHAIANDISKRYSARDGSLPTMPSGNTDGSVPSDLLPPDTVRSRGPGVTDV